MPIEERFKKYIGEKTPSGCIIWVGAKDANGYGRIGTGEPTYKTCLAHRVAWEISIGEIPKNIYLCHRCDNPSCVNTEHLFLGSQADNMRDMVSKGRSKKGSDRKLAKLTDEKVREIRKRYSAGGVSQSKLALEFGVSPKLICDTVNRSRWKHVI